LAQPIAEVFAKNQAFSIEAETRATIARAHLAIGEIEAAQNHIAQAASLANKSENKLSCIFVRIKVSL